MSALDPSNWEAPLAVEGGDAVLDVMYPLHVMNSLTRTKTRFIPRNPAHITWYQCGPTVYAESHMGHARTYVSLDVIRRIMKEFLGYNLVLCQNITDIDDKIIIRSSERKMPFRDLASKYEADFFDDMAKLGVAPPDMITRVSEYMPEIVDYILTLCDKGVAYESNGSVYFDTNAYQACGHVYGKLVPEQIGNSELLAEGEGALSAAADTKKNPSDFALWKKTKDQDPGSDVVEPFWESPWGNGRPGWHIECSVMSHYALKSFGDGLLDVHAGGVDLKFPHHENEEAQTCGFLGCKQWTNYWVHTGHLNIKGAKMSKSLKNFVTIKEALEMHSARQIRFCFILHKYNSTMDYSSDTMAQAVDIEKKFTEFFHNIKALLRREVNFGGPQYIGEKEERLLGHLESVKADVRACMLDDFDTPLAIKKLLELVKEVNRYVEDNGVNGAVLTSATKYVTWMLKVFGLIPATSEVGFPLDQGEGGGVGKEQIMAPLLDALTKFRENVRVAAMNKDPKAVLMAADVLRDDILPDLGVRMEDKGSGADLVTIWKLDDPEVLKLEKAQRQNAKAEKEKARAEAARRAQEKDEKSKIPPQNIFTGLTELYSAFDNKGIPTHDAANEPLSKGQIKKLCKEWEKQKDLHEKYLAKAVAAV
jgi:cysteinyl-tRNA synthetase